MFGFGGDKKEEPKPAAGGGEAAAAGGEGGDAPEEKHIGNMPGGDYCIHVFLQTAKNIIMENEDDVDAYVQIEACGQKERSATQPHVTPIDVVTLNEHIFINLSKMDNEVMKESNIKLTVLNKGYFKGDVIGQIELSLSKIYHKKDHVMKHQRLGLTNPNGDDFSKLTGTIVVSINVQGPGDEAQELKMGSAAEVDESKIIMPSQVKKEYKQLYLRVYQATHLPKMDYQMIGTGTIDAYLKLKYRGKKLKTPVIKQEDNLVPWMTEFHIPVEMPVVSNKLVLQVYDQDIGFDELAATTDLSMKSMIKYDVNNPNQRGQTQCKWINLFGAPVDRSGENSKKMNNDPATASNWKGRILVEYWAEDHKYPTFACRPIPADFDRYQFDHHNELRQYIVMGEFGQGLCLPGDEGYKLRFKLAEHMWESDKPKERTADWCRWDERFCCEVFALPYSQGKYMPTFYIYLVDEDGVEVCFFRDSLMRDNADQTYKNREGPVVWRAFEPDLSHGVVTDEKKAGYFSFRLYFHDVAREGPFDAKKYEGWKREPRKRQQSFKARVALYQCENLPPADEAGHSDPYIQVYDPSRPDAKTSVCNDTNNPIFYEVLEFTYAAHAMRDGRIDFAAAPPIVLNIFDHDDELLDSTDDLIGRAVIHLSDLPQISFDDEIPYPAWQPVKAHYDDEYHHETGASVLVSVQLAPSDFTFALPPEEIVLNAPPPQIGNQLMRMPNLHMAEFKCEVIVLGLRDLVSTGLMSVNKAYIKFALKSLLPVAQANAVDNIVTEPNAKGPNPIIRTTLQFEVQLPNDPTFLPRMTCEVFDQLFMGGVGQPRIGVFTLKFGEIVTEMREKIENDIRMAQQLAKTVEKVKNRIKGQPSDQRQRAAEICGSLSASQQDQVSAATDAEKVGLALLKRLDAAGLQLPTTNALKSKSKGKAKGRAHVAKKDGAAAAAPALMKHGTSDAMDAFSQKSPAEQRDEITRAVGGNLRKKARIAFEADLAVRKRELEQARKGAQKDLASRPGAYGNKVMPLYKYDERLGIDREVDDPPTSLFKAVGYNKKPEDGVRHYRRYYPDELEKVNDKNGMPIISSPFIEEHIFRAKPVKSGGLLAGLFGGDSGAESVSVDCGYFKGAVRCFIPAQRAEAEAALKAELKKLMQQILAVYEIEQGEKAPIKADAVELVDQQDGATGVATLNSIREVIELAGLEKLNIFPMIDDLCFQARLLARLNEVQTCKVFLYMIEGFNFAERDLFSASDPYLKVHCGKSKFSERDDYQLDTAEPKFFKCYQFQVDFPGSPSLAIEAWDYDDLFGDDLIGITKIDLDDRFYSQTWLALEDKPIEYRDLYEDSSTITQGVVKLWVEIWPAESAEAAREPLNIDPEPILEYECRVVVWKTRDIEMLDVEGTSDVFFRVFFDTAEDQVTDTHWRCQNGTASFNYRLKFPLKSPRAQGYTLTLQAWDKDIIASNDLIGSCALPIDYLMEDATLTDTPRYINTKYFDEWMKERLAQLGSPLAHEIEFDSEEKDRFWVPVHRFDQEQDAPVKSGEVLISVSVLPNHHAEKGPQGKGRDEPNSDPFCPPPEGRIKLSVNPFTMFQQLVGPAVRRQIYMALLCTACCFLCAMCAPMIFSNIVSKGITG